MRMKRLLCYRHWAVMLCYLDVSLAKKTPILCFYYCVVVVVVVVTHSANICVITLCSYAVWVFNRGSTDPWRVLEGTVGGSLARLDFQ